jgi:hypothetical protein
VTPFQQQQLADFQSVLDLKATYGWQVISRDALGNFNEISSTWFNLPEGSVELREARARQIANATILNLMEMYQEQYKVLAAEIASKDQPENIQTSDVDNGVEEESDE